MSRFVFIGSVKFSARCLDALLRSGADVADILSPKKPGINTDFDSLEETATRHGRTVRRFDAVQDELEHLRSLRPDVIFVLGLSRLIPESVLAVPRLGAIGSHPALLPRHRGRHPIIWALANGLDECGLTLFWLDRGTDSGDIWMQRRFPISPDDDAGTVYERVCRLGCEMLTEGLPELERGICRRTPQDESLASSWRKRGKEDGRIDWRMSSKRIHDLVRALHPPYCGAHCVVGSTDVKIWRVRPLPGQGDAGTEPGKVVRCGEDGFTVKTGDGLLEILEHEFPRLPQEGDYLL